jgi:hypothetical protein
LADTLDAAPRSTWLDAANREAGSSYPPMFPASMLMNSALRGQSLRNTRHTGLASPFLNRFCRVRSVDHRLLLPSYQPVICASVLDRSVMQYRIVHSPLQKGWCFASLHNFNPGASPIVVTEETGAKK